MAGFCGVGSRKVGGFGGLAYAWYCICLGRMVDLLIGWLIDGIYTEAERERDVSLGSWV